MAFRHPGYRISSFWHGRNVSIYQPNKEREFIMSSYIRNIQRKAAKQRPDYEPKPTPTIVLKHGYKVLRPTKGWLFMSARRLEAQRKMAAMLSS